MKKTIVYAGMLLASLSLSISSSQACTDFRLTAQDGTVFITRSLEFAADTKSNLISSPRGKTISNTTNDGKLALSWKSKYGYVFLDGFNTGMVMDGLNEQGLSVEALYMPGETQYQTVLNGQEAQALPYLRFGDWALGNFKTVDEVKQALKNIYIFSQKTPQTQDVIFPLHFAVYDQTGKGIVVELVGGKMNVYDNTLGVMTNSPTYHWQVTNLRNYVNLSPFTPKPIIDSGTTFAATGQGAGMMGLPGDVSPPSRFVKTAVMLKSVFTPANAENALNVAQHIINNFDIPAGFVREGQNINKATNETTEWVVFKDLTHKKFFYRTYGDLTLRSVDLSQIDFSENAPQLKMPIVAKEYILDMTPSFKKSRNG